MNPQQFVDAIKTAVHDASISGTIQTLEHPPGRRPDASLVELSSWYHAQSDSDKLKISEIITHAVHSSVFGFFCVLDGVRSIDSEPKTSELILNYSDAGGSTRLNEPTGESLHDIYQASVYDEVYKRQA